MSAASINLYLSFLGVNLTTFINVSTVNVRFLDFANLSGLGP